MESVLLDNGKQIWIDKDAQIQNDDLVYCPVLKKVFTLNLDTILMLKNLDYDENGNSKYKKEWLKKVVYDTK